LRCAKKNARRNGTSCLLRLALDILAKKAVVPAVFTNHQIITPDNVDHY